MMNRKMAAILQERQAQLAQHAPARNDGQPHAHSPRRPGTAGQGARPKVTCAMLNETERMLLRAPNRHKSMLSAGPCPTPALGDRLGRQAASPHAQARAHDPLTMWRWRWRSQA